MKINYIIPSVLACMTAMMTGCTDNSWNEYYIDDFNSNDTYSSPVTVSFDLTKEDYETIGNGLYNRENSTEENAAANSIKDNQYFDQSSQYYPMEVAMAWFLNRENTNFQVYDVGSRVQVGLTLVWAEPEELSEVKKASRLTLTENPSTANIPSLLKAQFPSATAGQYATVSYAGTRSVKTTAFTGTSSGKGLTRAGYWTPSYALSQIAGGYEDEATVGGYVISITELSTSYGNATYVIADNPTDKEGLIVYRGYYLDGEKFTSEDQLKVGQFVVVSGKLVNYGGTTPEFTSGNKIVSFSTDYEGSDDNTGGGNTGGDNTGGNTGGGNTGSGYWVPSYALSQIAGGFEGEATVGGYVISITDLSTSYGNATYVIADKATDSEGLIVYRGYYLDGEKFTSEDQLKIGDFVVVSGSLVNYGGTTPEFTTGSKILSFDPNYGSSDGNGGGSSGGDNTGGNGGSSAIPAQNWIYVFDGSNWKEADNAVVVQPQAYSEMGVTTIPADQAAFYLPIYMKKTYPYATPDTELFVAYNLTNSGCACSLLMYDGSEWTVNDNYKEFRVAEFVKTADGYQFRKFIGEETYIPFEEEEIRLNAGYLLVPDGYSYCGTPAKPTGTSYYAYIYTEDIQFNEEDGSVTLPNGNNTFYFLTEVEYNGRIIKAPEGKFVIQQSDGTYLYQGNPTARAYNFGVRANSPWINNGNTIQNAYLWSATKNADGTWTIACDYQYQDTGDWYQKIIYYSDGYKNFAAYTEPQLLEHPGAVYIRLYISEDYLNQDGSDDSDNGE